MKLIGIILFALGVTQCASVKFDKNPPFTITNADYENWVGGIPGVEGTNVRFYYTSNTNIAFDSIYFNGKKTKAELRKDDKGRTMLVGSFKTSNIKGELDLQLHSDPKQEYGNTPPQEVEKIPFELKKNEAIISYKIDNTIKYFKVENLQERNTQRLRR